MVAAIWRCLASASLLRWTRILSSKSINLSQVPGFAYKRQRLSNSFRFSDICWSARNLSKSSADLPMTFETGHSFCGFPALLILLLHQPSFWAGPQHRRFLCRSLWTYRSLHKLHWPLPVQPASQYPLDFMENLTDFLVGLFFVITEKDRNAIYFLLRFNFRNAANVVNSPSVYCSASDIRSNRISYSHHFHSHWGNCSNENWGRFRLHVS